MKNATDEFSFLLKPSIIPGAGIGVFAAHDIAKGTILNCWEGQRIIEEKEVPEAFKTFCLYRDDGKMICPPAFNHIWIGWYMNHSSNPNASHGQDYIYFASRDIEEGEEITIDYNTLEEPENKKDLYYKK